VLKVDKTMTALLSVPVSAGAHVSSAAPRTGTRMEHDIDNGRGTLTQLRAYLAQCDLAENAKLPPERELVDILGVSRSDLRKALAVLEREGELWRHVGKGTFLGARPAEELCSVAAIAATTNPAEVMRTRLLIEPMTAREAALNVTAQDVAELRACLRGTREARTWRFYESWDNRLHRTIAYSAHNRLLLSLFDTLNTVRRAVSWGRLRPTQERPSADHHSFADHARIVDAIENRDQRAAESAMRLHLEYVARGLMEFSHTAEREDEREPVESIGR
jgi:GntR family transcriptional regulator, transcriptional repressor for pyruvate dehydrogenase complex